MVDAGEVIVVAVVIGSSLGSVFSFIILIDGEKREEGKEIQIVLELTVIMSEYRRRGKEDLHNLDYGEKTHLFRRERQ